MGVRLGTGALSGSNYSVSSSILGSLMHLVFSSFYCGRFELCLAETPTFLRKGIDIRALPILSLSLPNYFMNQYDHL